MPLWTIQRLLEEDMETVLAKYVWLVVLYALVSLNNFLPFLSLFHLSLRFQSSKSGKIYLHRDIRLLFSRKSMEVDSGAAYELKSFTESPADPPFSPRC